MNASDALRGIVQSATPRLERLAGAEVTGRPAPGKWSKTEILGHLIDSAANNHHRFVRAQLVDELDFPSYEQDRWVELQDYAGADWREQLTLWRAYNLHLARVIERIPEAALHRRCRLGAEGVMTLGEIVQGYLIHLRHHLGQLVPDLEASAEDYRVLRADLESPDKAALAYRDFVRAAVRRCVLEWKTFRPDDVRAMAVEAGIPEADWQGVVDYVGNEIRGLHEGNAIRYRLRPEDLAGLTLS